MEIPKRALIVSQKVTRTSPRILKQILWLQENGWVVDTVGVGGRAEALNEGLNFEVVEAGILHRCFAYLFLRKASRYEFLFGQHLPNRPFSKESSYGLVIIHNLTHLSNMILVDWIRGHEQMRVMLDLHENFFESVGRSLLERLAFDGYLKWQLEVLQGFVSLFSRQLVIAAASLRDVVLYSEFLGQNVELLRNSSPYQGLTASHCQNDLVRLVHHGVGTRGRGLESGILAMRSLPDRFTLSLQLVSSRSYLMKLRFFSRVLGVSKRVKFLPPVDSLQIASSISEHDLAIIVIPPITENQLHTMPGKFFESIQGRLGIVTGPNPEMSNLVRSLELGLVLEGWRSRDIVAGLKDVTMKQISDFKLASDRASRSFSSDADQDTFCKLVSINFRE
jgi:hypothetical protein